MENIKNQHQQVPLDSLDRSGLHPAASFAALPPTIEWITHEFTPYHYQKSWYIIIGSVVGLLALWTILIQNYFFLAFIALALTLMLFYAKRTPQIITCAIAKEGIRIDRDKCEEKI